MPTKIGFLRTEFERIGCFSHDPDGPKVDVAWYFTKIRVVGKNDRTFSFDTLCAVLREVPNAAGEDQFWMTANEKAPPPKASTPKVPSGGWGGTASTPETLTTAS